MRCAFELLCKYWPFSQGNVALATEFYDAHAVSVDLLNNKHYYGLEGQ